MMLWYFWLGLFLLCGILAPLVLCALLAERRKTTTTCQSTDDKAIALDGKKRNKGMRKRKGGNVETADEDFTIIDHTSTAEETTMQENPSSQPSIAEQAEAEKEKDLETENAPQKYNTNETNISNNADEVPEPNEKSQQQSKQTKEKKPVPQSPLPQPEQPELESEEPSPNAQQSFLNNCQNATKCAECDQSFTLLWRRHHCRSCYHSVCAECSPNFATLLGFDVPVRVCKGCWAKLHSQDEEEKTSKAGGEEEQLVEETGADDELLG